MKPMFSKEVLEKSADLVHARMPPTPQYLWPLLSQRIEAEVVVKHENHTPTGAFKVRGGITYLHDLAQQGDCPGIITATRGNHGQSIPFAANPFGIPVRVYVPNGNSVEKNAAMQAFGADVVVHGSDFEEARQEAMRVGATEGLHPIPPFHELLLRGVASYGLELMTAEPDLDAIYVPIGMGSGICSLITVRDLIGHKADIIGVVSKSAPAYALSVAAGRVVSTETANTFADGMACRIPMQAPVDIIRAGAARIVQVSDDDIAQAMRIYYTDTHNLAESAGAAPLAALIAEQEAMKGKRLGVILSGGNVDMDWFKSILNGQTPIV